MTARSKTTRKKSRARRQSSRRNDSRLDDVRVHADTEKFDAIAIGITVFIMMTLAVLIEKQFGPSVHDVYEGMSCMFGATVVTKVRHAIAFLVHR